LLSISGKLADQLAHQGRDEVKRMLDDEIYEVLTELSAPAEVALRAAEAAKDG
jgi:hypothetical protein